MTPPLKMHGGKHYLADWIVDLMPKHHKYVELFAGGLAVLWAKNPEGVSEVVNDISQELMNFYAVIRDEELFEQFMRRTTATPFGRPVWEEARSVLAEPAHDNRVERAAAFFTLNRQSFAGRMKEFAPITKTRTRRGMNEQASAWLGAIEGLQEVHERLKRVVIENRPAVELIPCFDVEGAMLYADPPYPAETRSAPKVYQFEMTDADHAEFLESANALKHAKMLISGYQCRLYDEALRHWNRHECEVANHAASGSSKERKLEIVWANF
jgi:DNA adenine methylase